MKTDKKSKNKIHFGIVPKVIIPVVLGFAILSAFSLHSLSESLTWATNYIIIPQMNMVYGAMSDGGFYAEIGTKDGDSTLTLITSYEKDMFDFSDEQLKTIRNISDKSGISVTCLRYVDGVPKVIMTCGDIPMDEYTDKYADEGVLFEEGWSEFDVISDEDSNLWEATCICIAGIDETSGEWRAIATLYPTAEASRYLIDIFKYISMITLIFAGLVVLIVLAILSILVKRIRRVNSYIARIDGDSLPDDKLPIDSSDEITQMSQSINEMVDDIKVKNRMAAELSIASDIQESMLDTDFQKIPESTGIKLYASVDPAREVGGDFYDFFMVDDSHFGFLIADVSDKGVPAALFMAMSMSILRNEMKGILPLNDEMSIANYAISDGNEQKLFVTVWGGIIDLDTGILTYVNAAHNRPLLKTARGTYEFLPERHGPLMGVREEVEYKQSEIQLQPGDKLFLYTDGVTEAQAERNNFYGKERLSECLNKNIDLNPQETVEAVTKDLEGFVGAAEQFDDITMLVIEYNGKRNKHD